MNSKQKISLSIIGLIALLLASFGVYFINIAIKSKNWVKTPATVIAYTIKSRASRAQDSINRSHKFKKNRSYNIAISYQYKFNQITYTNNKFSFGSPFIKDSFKQRQEAISWLNHSKYAMGKQIVVYVNPDKPIDAVIKNGLSLTVFIPLLLAFMFVAIFIYSHRKTKPNN